MPFERLIFIVALLTGLIGCGTTPGRDKPLDSILVAVASPDGTLIAASTEYEEVALFDRAPLRFRSMLTRRTDRRSRGRSAVPSAKPFGVTSPLLAFAPDGRTLVAAGVADHLVAWDAQSREEKYRVALESGVLDLALFPDGRELVTAGPNAVFWTVRNGARAAELPLPAGTQAMSVAISPDGRVTLVGLSDGRIAVFESESRRLLRTLAGHAMPVYGVAFAPDGSTFASTAGQFDPRIWKADPKGEFSMDDRARVEAATAAQPSLDQAQALGGLLWLLGTVAGIHTVGAPTLGGPPLGPTAEAQLAAAPNRYPDPAWCPPRIAFSPDGRYLATTGVFPGPQTGSLVGLGLRLFVTDLKEGGTKSSYLGACSVAFTPDSKFLITRNTATRAAPVFWVVETLTAVEQASPR